MSREFNDVYNQFLSFNDEERINCAKKGIERVFEYLNSKSADKEFNAIFFASLIGFFIGADGKITPPEAKVFNQIFNTAYSPYELVDYISKVSTIENFDILNRIIDGMDEDTKFSACIIALAVISADNRIDDSEASLFEELWR